MKAIGSSFVGISLAGLLFTTGCGVFWGKSTDTVATRNGIPSARWQVGGGLDVSYTAPQDGNVYVVDQQTQRFLVTKSVEEGDNFTFGSSTQEYDVLGIDPHTAKIVVYFVPVTVFYPAPSESEE